jgi:hypothetical protein
LQQIILAALRHRLIQVLHLMEHMLALQPAY